MTTVSLIYELDYGVLLTTKRCGKVAKDVLMKHDKSDPKLFVRLIDRDALTDFILEYFLPNALLGKALTFI